MDVTHNINIHNTHTDKQQYEYITHYILLMTPGVALCDTHTYYII